MRIAFSRIFPLWQQEVVLKIPLRAFYYNFSTDCFLSSSSLITQSIIEVKARSIEFDDEGPNKVPANFTVTSVNFFLKTIFSSLFTVNCFER